jgi:hypothetical protein
VEFVVFRPFLKDSVAASPRLKEMKSQKIIMTFLLNAGKAKKTHSLKTPKFNHQ